MSEYVDFMFDKKNEFNCENCPENQGFDDWEGKLPCGQQNCWVSCHCRYSEEQEEERNE